MSDIPPDTNAMITVFIYAAVGFIIAWAARVLGFFGGRQIDRVKAVEDKQSATESRVNVLEATVVKDKEMRQALSSLRRDVDIKLETMNGSIIGATDKFMTEHEKTREVFEDRFSTMNNMMSKLENANSDEHYKKMLKDIAKLYKNGGGHELER